MPNQGQKALLKATRRGQVSLEQGRMNATTISNTDAEDKKKSLAIAKLFLRRERDGDFYAVSHRNSLSLLTLRAV